MRYAIFSDIQGNRTAWNVVAEDMKRQKVQTPVCLGDLVGSGPMPQEIIRAVRETTGNIILGDCDASVAGLRDDNTLGAGMRQSIEWTRSQLDQESLAFLRQTPPAIKTDDILFTHAEALEVSRFAPIDDIEKARANFASCEHHVTFVGHGHHRSVFALNEDGSIVELPAQDCQLEEGKRYIVNVGSVGTPPGANDFRARYAIYDPDTRELIFRLVPFPAEACRNDWKAAGLLIPIWLSQGLGSLPTGEPSGMPMPPGTMLPMNAAGQPEPTAPARPKWPLVVLLSGAALLTVAVVVVAGVFITSKMRDDGSPTPAANNSEQPIIDPPAPDQPDDPEPVPPEAGPTDTTMAATDPPTPEPKPEPEPEPPTVAVVPEPEPAPAPTPEPAPAPAPTPVGPAPIPPAPEDAATAIPVTQGLVFYTPLDEPEDEFTARDLVAGRDLDVSGGLPGSLGRVGFAVALEKQNGSTALISEAKPLPAMTAMTISFWIRRPDPDGDDETVPVEPPMNLVALQGYCDVRLEKNQVVANMELKGEAATVAFPADFDWHHVLVENGGGKTAIWIDHRSQSNPVNEKLAAPPETDVAVQIGSKGAHFHVDEVAIWNRKFTKTERQILYRNGRLDKPVLRPPKLVAHWKFDDKPPSRILTDTTGDHPLGAFKSWSTIGGITPNPVPLTEVPNSQAAQLWQLSERPEDAGSFQMNAKAGFTYEGWMKLAPGSSVLLGGVLPDTGEDARGGWRLDARPGEGVTGDLVFTYQNGPVTVEASAPAIPIYFGRPHHFAAVWNPLATPTHGTMEVHLDNMVVATTSVPLSDVGPPSDAPFRIVATKLPVVLDEVRFTMGALKPAEFLTSGIDAPKAGAVVDAPDTPPADESPMERRAREALERKQEADEKREARRREEEAKRNRSK